MSESTTKTTKTAKSESKSAKPESKSASGDGASAKTADSATTKSDSKPGEKSTKGRAAADSSPSYFSSVSSPEYRSGWDSVFASGKGTKKAAAKPRRAKTGNGLPVTIELDHADLDDDIRAAIEDAFRRKARKKRVKFDQFMKKAQVTWRLECHFTN
ncbi:MAG: hypothetical protein VCB77_12025 [Alphaproteobacteria bacterium]